MDLGIAGKWALVCGASKGLGFGCAEALAREGANVVIAARTPQTLEAAAARLRAAAPRATIEAVAADVTTVAGREKILAHRAACDILVTNAGGPPPGDFREWDRATWIGALDANMLSAVELIRSLVDGMVERGFGRIVNITSTAVKSPLAHLGLSNGARSGLTGFVAGLARQPEFARAGVTINNLLPGFFDTDRLRGGFAVAARRTGQDPQALADARCATIPARRLGSPQEFGAICAWLCSRQAGYLTGQNILADGGAYPGTF